MHQLQLISGVRGELNSDTLDYDGINTGLYFPSLDV